MHFADRGDRAMWGFIFDLDGVITDTAKYHYLAWKIIADELKIPFTEEINERLKGVSREKSFEIILEVGKRLDMKPEERAKWCERKNKIYIDYIKQMNKDEVLPGVRVFLEKIRRGGDCVALGSASKNSRIILERLELQKAFDVIVDGTMVTKAKPDPEVFLQGAQKMCIDPERCIVFEDSKAGIEAAHRGGMKAIGIGDAKVLREADGVITGFEGWTPEKIVEEVVFCTK